MRIAYTVILAFLIFAGAAPTNNLERDLKQAANHAQILINKDEIRTNIALAESIKANNIAPKEEIEKWQTYSAKLSTWNVTISRDYAHLEDSVLTKISMAQIQNQLDQYTNGAYSKFKSDFIELKAKRFAAFKIEALQMLDDAKKAGISHILIDKKSTDYEQGDSNKRERFFESLVEYLYRKM